VEKLSYDDIASALEVPSRTAMSRLATARDQVSIKASRLPGGA
jgi:DNA-directed RNA polymerase specialized sigma24 family protein